MSFQIRGKVWPGNRVPVAIAPELANPEIPLAAMEEIENLTGRVKFVAWTSEMNHIEVVNGTSFCRSNIGMTGGKQQVLLQEDCSKTAAIHEFMHALGFHHEHVRYDRDTFVTIQTNEIIESELSNFQIPEPGSYVEPSAENTYDFLSIMHYSATQFAKPPGGATTILCKPDYSQYQSRIGRGPSLSDGDIAGVRSRYEVRLDSMTIINQTSANVYYWVRWGTATWKVHDTCLTPGQSATYSDIPNSQFAVGFKDGAKMPLVELDYVDISSTVEISGGYTAWWGKK